MVLNLGSWLKYEDCERLLVSKRRFLMIIRPFWGFFDSFTLCSLLNFQKPIFHIFFTITFKISQVPALHHNNRQILSPLSPDTILRRVQLFLSKVMSLMTGDPLTASLPHSYSYRVRVYTYRVYLNLAFSNAARSPRWRSNTIYLGKHLKRINISMFITPIIYKVVN